MFKQKDHIRKMNRILLMCFVLFAFSPCVLKDSFFGITHTESAKPLNKTKSTKQICKYVSSDRIYKTAFTDSLVLPDLNNYYDFSRLVFAYCFPSKLARFNTVVLANAPPKYILYKRLKFDIV